MGRAWGGMGRDGEGLSVFTCAYLFQSCLYDFCPVVRLDSSQPVRYGIKVELDSKYVVLKEKLSQLAGILLTRIHLVEVSAYTVKVRGRGTKLV